MEGRGRRAVKILIATLSVLTVVAAAFVLEGILYKDSGGRWPWFFGASARSPVSATVTYIQRYSRCGDAATSAVEVASEELPGVLAGLSGGWAVKESGDLSATIERNVDGFCPDHEGFRFIALYRAGPIEKPHVCVFRGKKADPAFILRERRDLTEGVLYGNDLQLLRAGVLVFPETNDPPDLDLDEKADQQLDGIAKGR